MYNMTKLTVSDDDSLVVVPEDVEDFDPGYEPGSDDPGAVDDGIHLHDGDLNVGDFQ